MTSVRWGRPQKRSPWDSLLVIQEQQHKLALVCRSTRNSRGFESLTQFQKREYLRCCLPKIKRLKKCFVLKKVCRFTSKPQKPKRKESFLPVKKFSTYGKSMVWKSATFKVVELCQILVHKVCLKKRKFFETRRRKHVEIFKYLHSNRLTKTTKAGAVLHVCGIYFLDSCNDLPLVRQSNFPEFSRFQNSFPLFVFGWTLLLQKLGDFSATRVPRISFDWKTLFPDCFFSLGEPTFWRNKRKSWQVQWFETFLKITVSDIGTVLSGWVCFHSPPQCHWHQKWLKSKSKDRSRDLEVVYFEFG